MPTRVLGAHRVRPGDVLVALGSSGVHSNGYSLVRHVLFERAGLPLADTPAELGGRTLGDELLTPTRIYARDCLALVAPSATRTRFAHITGGGLAAQSGAGAARRRASQRRPGDLGPAGRSSTWWPRAGVVPRAELELTFNLGVGMIAVLPPDRVDAAMSLLTTRGVPAWVLGDVRTAGSAAAQVTLLGAYAGPAGRWR